MTERQKREDEILNPLNNIMLIAYGTTQYPKIKREINRVTNALVQHRVISPRKNITAKNAGRIPVKTIMRIRVKLMYYSLRMKIKIIKTMITGVHYRHNRR